MIYRIDLRCIHLWVQHFVIIAVCMTVMCILTEQIIHSSWYLDTLNTLVFHSPLWSSQGCDMSEINCIKFSTILDVSQSYNPSEHSTIHCWNLSLIDCYRNLKISHFSCHAFFSVFSTILWYFFFHLHTGSLLYGFFRQGLKCEGELIVEWIFLIEWLREFVKKVGKFSWKLLF